MEYPLIGRELIAYLKLVHGAFNLAVAGLFVVQGRYGLQIRRARRSKTPMPLTAIRRHRQFGPKLAILGAAGFFAGLTLVLVDTGRVFTYPAHLLAGVIILCLLCWTYLVSRKISGGENRWRELHFRLGLAILALYLVNLVLGIGAIL